MEEDIKGKFVTRTKGNGIKYKLYVPENVNADTPIFVYAYGSGDPYIEKCVSEQGSDSIIIATVIDYGADLANKTMDIVNEVKQEFDVTSTIVSPSGFSLGGPVGLKVTAENIRRNPDCEPQTVFLIDAYGTYFYNPKLHLNDTETMNLFKENNTVFFAFDLTEKKTDVNTLYAKAGLNLITVKCIGQGHMEINEKFFSNGLYDYRANEKLPKDGYVYSIYNSETDSWEEIPYDKVETLADVYSLFGIEYNGVTEHKYTIEEMANLEDIELRSSDSALATLLNGIRGAIRNSNIVSNGYSSGGCSSTTLMPSQVPAVVSKYFEATMNSLSKLINETDQFAKISESIKDMDFNLERKACELDAIDITVATYGSDYKKENSTIEEVDNTENQLIVSQKDIVTNNSDVTDTNNDIDVLIVNDSDSLNNSEDISNNIDSNVNVYIDIDKGINKVNPVYDFMPYDKVVSNENRVVFESNDGYKVVLHIENDSIIGIEYYYDLNNTRDITLSSINDLYKENEYLKEIISEDNYVKVIFEVGMYKDSSFKEVKELYVNDSKYTFVEECE